MAARSGATGDAAQFKIQRLTIEHRHDPVQGPGKGQLLIAPAHLLWKRNIGDEAGEPLAQKFRRGPPLHLDAGGDHLALWGCLASESGDVHPLAPGESQRRRGGPALGIVGRANVGAEVRLNRVGLPGRDLAEGDGKPSRRPQDPSRAGGNAVLLEIRRKPAFEMGERGADETRGDLLGADFQK